MSSSSSASDSFSSFSSWIISVALLLLATSIDLSSQQMSNCNGQLNRLIPCLAFVQGQASEPAQGCCTGLSSVATSNPACLCSIISGNAGSIPGINSSRALELPTKCNLQGLNPKLCNGNLQAPGAAPLLAPQVSPVPPAMAPALGPQTSPLKQVSPAPAMSPAFSPQTSPLKQVSQAPTIAPAFGPQTSPLKQVAPAPALVPVFSPQTSPRKQQVVPAPAPAPRHRGGHRHRRPAAAPTPGTAAKSPLSAPELAPATGTPRSSGGFLLPSVPVITGVLVVVLGMF